MLRICLFLVPLLFALVSGAATHQQRLAELDSHPEVLVAWLSGNFALITRTNEEPRRSIYTGEYTYLQVDGAALKANTVRVYAIDLEQAGEAVYWMDRPPSVLAAPAPGVQYLTGRTVNGWGDLTETQQRGAIEDFANSAWKAFVHAGAGDIREFTASPIDGNTVMVTGWFDMPTADAPWEKRTYYIHLVDANGSVAVTVGNTNFTFEQRADE